jgi:hypothetical protein
MKTVRSKPEGSKLERDTGLEPATFALARRFQRCHATRLRGRFPRQAWA